MIRHGTVVASPWFTRKQSVGRDPVSFGWDPPGGVSIVFYEGHEPDDENDEVDNGEYSGGQNATAHSLEARILVVASVIADIASGSEDDGEKRAHYDLRVRTRRHFNGEGDSHPEKRICART